MKKMSWYVGAIVGTAAAISAFGSVPASAAGGSESAQASAVASATSTELSTSFRAAGSTVTITSKAGLKKIWEW